MSVDDSHERPPEDDRYGRVPPEEETLAQPPASGATPYGDPQYPGGDPYAQAPGNQQEQSKTPLILAAIALALAAIGLIVGIVALTNDDEAQRADEVSQLVGVGTDDIQDGAVTSVKLAPGAVGPGKLADIAVTDPKIDANAVTTDAIADGAVTPAKLSDSLREADLVPEGSVTSDKLAEGAVERRNIADEAVNGRKVEGDSLGGDQIDESTLDVVPAAETAVVAETAAVAEVARAIEGGGEGGAAAPLSVEFVQASSDGDPASVKGPVTAECPAGSQVVGGGATIVGPEGAGVPVALVTSTASGNGWAGSARAYAETGDGWRIDVTAVCTTS